MKNAAPKAQTVAEHIIENLSERIDDDACRRLGIELVWCASLNAYVTIPED